MNDINASSGDSIAVVEQSLLALSAGMSAQSRRDAKTTFQFASRVASRLHDRDGESEAWFNKFLEVMRTLGWVAGRRSYERDYDKSASLTMGPIAFKVASAAGKALLGGPVGEAMAKLAGDAITALGNIEDAQKIYKQNVKGNPVSTTGLGTCIETPEGELFMLVNAFSASPSENDLNTTVFEWKSSSKDRYCGSAVLALNEVVYTDQVRATIEQKLADKAVKAADEYEI
ncbi:hypothetical protein AL532_10555 [Pseudomonas monteilii]|uniref:Uncharacterized protein n=2 Tax=Pseudomonas TaxID=286 RepID=A0ACC5UT64_9PSED|nr:MULTISPECIES: hypothetical protein [Pseudomonas]AVH36730.1 hypothetical protein AL532_10555 [Pseudomonas monteilii]MBV4517556.1 hypothetical protein [Pseudomonas kurunegalensis]MBZ3662530.1 hypothetical protein [Pseudomonas monteilii]MBZ3667856.1 hypothetical protein [Pseudomonas monteilii]MCE0908175.1 hypothetical protein [Pseudomonas kurunegalensis]